MRKLLIFTISLFLLQISVFAQKTPSQTIGNYHNTVRTLGDFSVDSSAYIKGLLYSVQSIQNRNEIVPNYLEEGAFSYVKDSGKTYQLVGGIDSSNWIEFKGGGSSHNGVDTITVASDSSHLNIQYSNGNIVPLSFFGGGIGDSQAPITWSVLDSLNNVVSPNQGDIYLVSTSPTGSFAGQANNIATYDTTAGWTFQIPTTGNLLYNTKDYIVSKWNGATWLQQPAPLVQNWWSRVAWNGAVGQFIQTGAPNSYLTMYGGLNGNNTGLGQQVFTDYPAGNGGYIHGNTALGALSQYHNYGYNNTSVGFYSLWYNVSGHDQVAIGNQAMGTGNKIYSIGLGTNAPNNNNTFSISDSTNHFYMKLDSVAGTAPSVIGKDGLGFWHVYAAPAGGSTPSLQAVTDVGYITTNPVVSFATVSALNSSNGNFVGLDWNGSGLGNPAVTFSSSGNPVFLSAEHVSTSRGIELPDNTGTLLMSVNGVPADVNGNVNTRLKSYTVSTLPASPTQGDEAAVTDATSPTYLGSLTGGGSVYTPVVFNGTIWISH